jgi:hypothetical protein
VEGTQDSWVSLVQAILMILITVLLPVLAAYARVLLMNKIDQAKANLTNEQYQAVSRVVDDLVRAAEQYDLATKIKRVGNEKKAWVVGETQRYLDSVNFPIDTQLIFSLIESSVYNGFTQPDKWLPVVEELPELPAGTDYGSEKTT